VIASDRYIADFVVDIGARSQRDRNGERGLRLGPCANRRLFALTDEDIWKRLGGETRHGPRTAPSCSHRGFLVRGDSCRCCATVNIDQFPRPALHQPYNLYGEHHVPSFVLYTGTGNEGGRWRFLSRRAWSIDVRHGPRGPPCSSVASAAESAFSCASNRSAVAQFIAPRPRRMSVHAVFG